MASVIKKISELDQLAELSSSSNVIIEENGEAKRFNANNIGKVKTVNGVEPDESGNVVVEAPEVEYSVTSVNGMTGNVVIEIPEVNYPVTSVNDMTGDVVIDIPDSIPTPTTATVGQTVVVKAVDENGKPTEWGTVNIPDVSGQINAHNTATDSHNDIRLLVEGLTTRLNTLADSDDTTLDQMSEIVNYIKSNKTLIEEVTTNKVNVTDIIDNLTTNVTNKPLSAAQGVALKALIDAIDVPTKVSELTNDSGYLTSYTETDPTVPAWAKAATKPAYTKNEIGLGNVDNVKQYSVNNPPVVVQSESPTDTSVIWVDTDDNSVDDTQFVSYEPQTLTEAQKAQARKNIGIYDDSPEILITTNEFGYWYNNNGVPTFYVPTDGAQPCSKETNYIEARDGDAFRVTLRSSNGHEANGGWYDENKNLISIIIVEENGEQVFVTRELTAPAGTAYVRFFSVTYSAYVDDNTVVLEVEYLGQEEDTVPANPLKGKKIVYDGDSICSSWGSTNGGSYPQIIADIVGGAFDNQGVGGGRIVTQEGADDTFHSIVDNLVNLPTDGDLYCFEGGVNDHWNDVILGTYSQSDYTGALDKTTYCGALETIFRYAIEKFVGKPICYIITHKCPFSAFSTYGTEHTFADFREAALGICEKYSIPVYDAWKDSGINSWNAAQLANFFIVDENTGTGDGTHPNEAGYRRYYVPQLIDLFERIMPIDVEDVESPGEPDIPVEPGVPDESEPTYTNLIPTAVDVDGQTIYNGKGYNDNVRMSGSSGSYRDNTGSCCTGYIKIPESGTITVRMKNITNNTFDNYGCAFYFFIGTGVACSDNAGSADAINNYYSPVKDSAGNITEITTTNTRGWTHMVVGAVNIDDTSIITVNEPIE